MTWSILYYFKQCPFHMFDFYWQYIVGCNMNVKIKRMPSSYSIKKESYISDLSFADIEIGT